MLLNQPILDQNVNFIKHSIDHGELKVLIGLSRVLFIGAFQELNETWGLISIKIVFDDAI